MAEPRAPGPAAGLLQRAAWKRESAMRCPRRMWARSYVYFIRSGNSGPIKIGWAASPAARIVELQVGNHEELRIVAVVEGGKQRERDLHGMFRAHHIRGEWFSPALELLAWIEEHGEGVWPPS